MNRLIYASSESCADLLYLTGFMAEDPFLFFEADGVKSVAVSELELGRAQKECHRDVQVIDVTRLAQHFKVRKSIAKNWLARMVLTICRGTKCREWHVHRMMPVADADLLRRSGLRLVVEERMAPGREVKTPEEIEKIRHSQRLAEAGLAVADGILRQSTVDRERFLVFDGRRLTAEELRGAIDGAIARGGGLGRGTIAAPGVQGADPHSRGEGPIRANEPIVMDIFPRDQATGYYGDLTRTRVKGSASPVVRKAYETVLAAQEKALGSLKAGVAGEAIHQAAADYFKEAGFKTGKEESSGVYYGFFHGLGHSVGLEIHESPSLSLRQKEPLRKGNVVTVEPGLYYPEWGGIRIEDTVAVAEGGIDNLTVAEKFLEL